MFRRSCSLQVSHFFRESMLPPHHKQTIHHILASLLLCTLTTACYGPALILTKTETIEADILRRESNNLIVLVDSEQQNLEATSQEKQRTIPISDIREIQHPGDVGSTAGAIVTLSGLGVTGIGALMIAYGGDYGAFVIGSFIFLIGSATTLVGGITWLTNFIIYESSKDAAENNTVVSVHFTPLVGLQNAGLGIELRW